MTTTYRLRLPVTLGLLFGLICFIPACAQQNAPAGDPDRVVAGSGQMPEGWSVRPDRGTASQIMFKQAGDAFHFTMGPAATFYNAGWTKSGDYSFSAHLTQTKAPTHPISYGLMIGGSDLDGANQTYTYFLVRNQGEYFIANRDGSQRNVVVNWTSNDAIAKQGDDGRQSNTLAVQVQGENVIFSVNGKEVTRLQKSQIHADGMNGFRIGHNLDVEIDQVSR
jgi:hypothetical protein